MSRRVRALGFLLAAAVAAAAAAVIANGYGASVVRGYGELRPVVIATSELPAGKPIAPEVAAADLEVRRVPVRFTPPDALAVPSEAVGLAPSASVPGGSYLLAAQLHPPRSAAPLPGLGGGRRPVQIAVSGAGALETLGAPLSSKVDVAVTSESDGSGDGRTYVAAAAVPLLGLGPGGEGVEGETATATLALTRAQALRLIQAESFARRITLIPRG